MTGMHDIVTPFFLLKNCPIFILIKVSAAVQFHSLLNPRYLGGFDTLPLRVTETGTLAGLAGDTDTPVSS